GNAQAGDAERRRDGGVVGGVRRLIRFVRLAVGGWFVVLARRRRRKGGGRRGHLQAYLRRRCLDDRHEDSRVGGVQRNLVERELDPAVGGRQVIPVFVIEAQVLAEGASGDRAPVEALPRFVALIRVLGQRGGVVPDDI